MGTWESGWVREMEAVPTEGMCVQGRPEAPGAPRGAFWPGVCGGLGWREPGMDLVLSVRWKEVGAGPESDGLGRVAGRQCSELEGRLMGVSARALRTKGEELQDGKL